MKISFTWILIWGIGFMLSPSNSAIKAFQILVGDASTKQSHPDKKLMERYCDACHNPTRCQADRLAPPMIAINTRYMMGTTSKQDFIANIQKWIQEPSERHVKMFGAVNRFGIMPKMPYTEKVIEQKADYVYDNSIEQPAWFQNHRN